MALREASAPPIFAKGVLAVPRITVFGMPGNARTRRVEVAVVDHQPGEADADLVAIGLPDGAELPEWLRDAPGASDARSAYKRTTLIYSGRPERTLVVGLGKGEDLDAERLRVAAAIAAREAGKRDARSIAWVTPSPDIGVAAAAAALADGTILASYRFDRFKSRDPDDPPPALIERLTLLGGGPPATEAARIATVASEATNRARELQDLPANVLTPAKLAERAEEIAAAHDAISVEVMGRDEIERRGMGALTAVGQGSIQEPRLITLRYGAGERPALGLVGKAITFDTGGISIKPAARMQEMKMDMSGGAAVLETMAAIAELGLDLDVVAVVPSAENMPSGDSMRPGDIVTALNGKTIEINNTDAEGRLVLADGLCWCVEQGAERIVDIATLTGAIVIALGSTYAGLVSNDDELAEGLAEAGDRTGELTWRLPLHPEYKELTRGTVADLTNASEKRKASPLYAASFLEEFVDGRPWAHLDIAGTAWGVGREYVGKGPSGYGVRLLVELARQLAESK
jgi:leucyl aminopeptidase